MTNKTIYAFAVLLFLAIGCAPKTANVLPAVQKLPITSIKKANAGLSPERLKRMDSFLEKELIANKIPGVVTLIKRRGTVAYSQAHGPKSPDDPTPIDMDAIFYIQSMTCLLYTSPSPRDATLSRMPSSA